MSHVRKLNVVPLALVSIFAMLVTAQLASGHVRPKGATPLRESLVPAFKLCNQAGANRKHNSPIALPSCNPPVQTSNFLTVGTLDTNGAMANFDGGARLDVISSGDVKLNLSMTDIRCFSVSSVPGFCNNGNVDTSGNPTPPDYTGELQDVHVLRITDHANSISGTGGTDDATVIDFPFPIDVGCFTTVSTSIGSDCNVSTTFNAANPGAFQMNNRAVLEVQQAQVFDGGSTGVPGANNATLFADLGLFLP